MRRLALVLTTVACLVGLGAPLSAPKLVTAQSGGPPMSATLFTNRVTWTATPGTAVVAVVRDATGVRARGMAQANAAGVVNLQLQNARGGGGPGGGGGGGGGNNQYLRAGDTISLTLQGAAPTVAVVPDLAADIDPATDKITGKAPAGSEVEVTVKYGAADTDTLTQKVTADAGGMYQLNLSGQHDLKPGAAGSATMTLAAGHKFTAQFAVLEANFSVGSRSANGRATLGTTVQVTLTGSGGAAKGSRSMQVWNNPDWTMQGGGGGGGGGGMNQLQPVAVGDTAKVTQSGGAIAAPRDLSILVPPMQVSVDKNTGRVSGIGPANSNLLVEAVGPDGTTVTVPVTTDANGAFSVSLAGQADLGPGWRVFVSYDPGNGLRVRSLFLIPQIVVRLYGTGVSGVAQPNVPVTVTVRTEVGDLKGMDGTVTNPNGNFNTNISANDEPISIDPGDVVEVDFSSGDPTVLPVPLVTVHTDVAGNVVSGDAPAGGKLLVVGGQGQNQVRLNVTADANNKYRAEFAAQYDIVAPSNGAVTLTNASGHQFVTGWAAVQMTMSLDGPNVVGNGPPGRRVGLVLKTNTGATAATASTRLGDGGGGGGPGGGGGGNDWAVTLRDNASQTVGLRTGDTLVATVGDDVIHYVLPQLNGVALIAEDTINGQAEANAAIHLTITAQGGGGPGGIAPVQRDVTADAGGLFTDNLTGVRDLIYNDVIQLRMPNKDHIVLRTIRTPGLRLNLNTATLNGSLEPNVDILARLVGADGRERARSSVTADETATFAAPWVDNSGVPIVPNAGDEVIVTSTKATQANEIKMTVPELTINPDKTADTVTGRATPGGTLTLQVQATFFRPGPGGGGGGGATRPQIQPDGTWQAQLGGGGPGGGRFDVVPGQQFGGQYRLPVGHLVNRAVNVPIVNAQIGGGRVCGVAAERVNIDSTLSGAGPAASGSDRSANDGSFEVRLVNNQGMEVASAAGQKVSTNVTSETIDVTLPDVTVSVDWTTGRVTGKGPADTTIYVSTPIRGCLGNRDFAGGPGGGGFNFNLARTNATGDFNTQVQINNPGDGFEVAMFTAEGHRVYRHVYRTLGQIYVRTENVGGRATPLTPVTIVVLAAGGAEKGRTVVTALSDGTFLGRVLNPGGAAISIASGDTVRLEAGAEVVTVPVEDLTFDFEPVNGMIGSAPANRALMTTMRLYDGRTLRIPLTTDASGRFAYRAADIPPRSNWTFADVRMVRVVLPAQGGHEIIAEMTVQGTGPTPTPPPGVRTKNIYMPFLAKKR